MKQRGPWAVEKLRLVEVAERRRRIREFVSGEGFTYLGRSFRLAVRAVAETQVGHARMDRGWLEVRVGQGLGGAARARAVRKALMAWFRERAAARLSSRLKRFTEALDDTVNATMRTLARVAEALGTDV